MTLMQSPDGEERDIKPEGVDALTALGWTEVEPKKASPKKASSSKPKK